VDDLPPSKKFLEVWPLCAPHAHARILKRDVSAARAMPGIRGVLMAEDVPGVNDAGTKHDEILLPDKLVSYHGQIVALIVGDSVEACRAAASKVIIDYEPLPPVLTLPRAIAQKSFHNEPNFIRRGNIETALKDSPLTFSGIFELGGQEHFYLETQAAWAEPGEDNSVAHQQDRCPNPADGRRIRRQGNAGSFACRSGSACGAANGLPSAHTFQSGSGHGHHRPSTPLLFRIHRRP
jgi:xanthine dehydrogenase molybdopterin-binding subunit B